MVKFCTNCGNQLEDYYNVCPNCGIPSPKIGSTEKTSDNHSYYYYNNTQVTNPTVPVQQNGIQFGWVVLGFFIPIVGWILWYFWNDTKPETAKAAGIAGIIGFILNIILIL